MMGSLESSRVAFPALSDLITSQSEEACSEHENNPVEVSAETYIFHENN